MTMHPSLRSSGSKKRHRSVLKRFERIAVLMEKEKWNEGQSVFGLPKVKTLKMKIKREKAAEAEAAVSAEGTAATAPAAGAKTTAASPATATTAKNLQVKKEEKKK